MDTRRRDSQMAPMTGDYNKLNASQSTVWKFAQPLFDKALSLLLSSPGTTDTADFTKTATSTKSVFRVADLGCATGGNSIAPLRYIVNNLNNNNNNNSTSTTAIECFLCDLPHNAWTEVSTTVSHESLTTVSCLINEEDCDKSRTNDVFVYMVGRTFYDCCVSPSSLDMSYSLVAAHWMKSHPIDFVEGLYATDPIHNTNKTKLQMWRHAGARDFKEFINQRYVELRPGGCFVGVFACPKLNGDYPWSQVGRQIYDSLLSSHVVKESPDVLASCILPVCWRTEQDVRDGFSNDDDSTKDDIMWDVHVCEFHETKDPVRESYDRGEIAAMEYGRAVIESFKAVGHRTCLASLSNQLGDDNANQVLEDAYDDSVAIVASDPNKYNLDVSFWYVLAQKKY
jgi:SAM dependent carboxyl methyltransferase